MIELKKLEDCCGCTACYSICPVNAISMNRDCEGFLYPSIDLLKCVKCNKCEKVCPTINSKKNYNENYLKIAYAARSSNKEILSSSTSGGMCYVLSSYVLQNGGVVFGATYGENNVVEHQVIDSLDDLKKLQGSKYVQSMLRDTYKLAKAYLEKNVMVLFTGMPCQIEGLKSFLQKNYRNLYTIDLICHGVPSPMLWEKYIKEKHYENASEIDFRRKKDGVGWEKNAKFFVCNNNKEIYESFYYNVYTEFFSHNLSLRPICFSCPFKTGYKKSDITCADLWGISKLLPDYENDDCGMSLCLIHSLKGKVLFENVQDECTPAIEISFDEAIKENMMFLKSVQKLEERDKFFEDMLNMNCKQLEKKYISRDPIILSIKKKLYPIKEKIKKIKDGK